MKNSVILFLLCINLKPGFAQSKDNIQSYKDIITTSVSYNLKIKAYIDLSYQLMLRNADSAFQIINEGLKLASAERDSLSIGKLIQNKGLALNITGKRDSCAYYLYQAGEIFNRNHYDEPLAWVYNDIARLYRKTNDYDKALEYYNKALAIFKHLRNTAGLGVIYNESGVVFEGKGDFDEAIRRYSASLQIQTARNDSVGIGYALDFLSGAYLQKGDVNASEQYGLKALNIRSLIKDSFALAVNYTNLGDIYAAAKKYDNAKDYYLKSNELATKIKYADLLANNYKQLSELETQQSQFQKAYDYLQLYNQLNDSIYQITKTKQIQELSAKYETAEKEKQIQQQQFEISKRNYYIAGILLIFTLFSMLAYSFYKRYKLKQQSRLQEEIILQQDMAAKAVIEAEEKERKRIAGDLHDGVGQMMSAARMNLSALSHSLVFSSADQRNSFERVTSLIDDSCNEVRVVSHNMMPNALVKSGLAAAVKEFLDRIDIRIIKIDLYTEGLDEKINSNIETVLYRVIQECVNNVIKHSGASRLDISLIKDNAGINVTVEDNGKGFEVHNKPNFNGMGLQNILTRIEYLKGTVEWDSAPGKGTVVAIYVPLS
jgi:signal transduction histidine kinase